MNEEITLYNKRHEISVDRLLIETGIIDQEMLGRFSTEISKSPRLKTLSVKIENVTEDTITYAIDGENKTTSISAIQSNKIAPLKLKDSTFDEVWSNEKPSDSLLVSLVRNIKRVLRKLAQILFFLDPHHEDFEVNLELLQSCMGTFSPDSKLKMSEAFKYQANLISRHSPEDTELLEQLRRARTIAKRVEAAQKLSMSGQKKAAVEVTDMIQKQLDREDRILIPAGFFLDASFVDVLLDVRKTPEGKACVRVITLHEGFDGFSSQKKEGDRWRRQPVREYSNVDLEVFKKEVLPALSSMQMPKAYETEVSLSFFQSLMVFFASPSSTQASPKTLELSESDFLRVLAPMGTHEEQVQDVKFKKPYAAVGKAKTLYTYVQSEKSGDYQKLKLQGELNLIRELWKESDQWKKDSSFRILVRSSCVKAIRTAYKHREALFGENKTNQALELESLQNDLEQIINEIDQYQVTIPLEKKASLSSKPFGTIDLSPVVKLSTQHTEPTRTTEIEIKQIPEESPKEALALLHDWIQVGQSLIESKQHKKLEHFVTNAILQLPNLDSSLWTSIGAQEIVADGGWAETMRDLGEMLVIARAHQDLGDRRGSINTPQIIASAYLCMAQNKLVEGKIHEGERLDLNVEGQHNLAFETDIYKGFQEIGRTIPPGIAREKAQQIAQAITGKEGLSLFLPDFYPNREPELPSAMKQYLDSKGGFAAAYQPRENSPLPKTVYCLRDLQAHMRLIMTDCRDAYSDSNDHYEWERVSEFGKSCQISKGWGFKVRCKHEKALQATRQFRVAYDMKGYGYYCSPELHLNVESTLGRTAEHWIALSHPHPNLSYPITDSAWNTLFRRFELRDAQRAKYKKRVLYQEHLSPSVAPFQHWCRPYYLWKQTPKNWHRSRAIAGLSEEEVKDLRVLQLADRSPIDTVISTFFKSSNQLHFFERGDLLFLFEMKFFAGNALEEWAESEPDKCVDLANRIRSLHAQTTSAKPMTAIYMLKLSAHLRQMITTSQIENQDRERIIDSLIPNEEEKLAQLLGKGTILERRMASTTYLDLMSYSPQLTPSNIASYLFARYQFNTLPTSPKWNSPLINDNIHRLELQAQSQVLKSIASDTSIQKSIIHKIAPKSLHNKVWEYQNGVLQFEEHTIDLKKGLYFVNGESSCILPEELASSFQGRFKEEALQCKISFKHDKTSNAPCTVYTPFDYPNLEMVVKSIGEAGECDIVVLENREINGKKRHCQHIQLHEDLDVPVSIRSAIGSCQCLRDTDAPERIYAFDNTGALYATMHISKENGLDVVKRFIRQDGLELLNISSNTRLSSFDAIEHPDQILIFGKGKQVKEVVYPRLKNNSGTPLTIEIPGRNVRGFDSYRWNPNHLELGKGIDSDLREKLPSILNHNYTHFQLLEHSDGSQRVLINPRQIIAKESSIPVRAIEAVYKFGTTPHLDSEEKNLEDRPLFEYRLDQRGRLKGETPESNLYLAYVFFSSQNYSEALHYLKESRTSYGLSSEALQILDWMRTWPDASHNANAFKLQLYCFTHQTISESGKQKPIGELELRELSGFAKAFKAYKEEKVSTALRLQPHQLTQCQEIADESIEFLVGSLLNEQLTKPANALASDQSLKIPAEEEAQNFAKEWYLEMRTSTDKALSSSSEFFVINSEDRLFIDFSAMYENLRTEPVTSDTFRRLKAEIAFGEESKTPQARAYLQTVIELRLQGKQPSELTPFPNIIRRPLSQTERQEELQLLNEAKEKDVHHAVYQLEALLKNLSRQGKQLPLNETQPSIEDVVKRLSEGFEPDPETVMQLQEKLFQPFSEEALKKLTEEEVQFWMPFLTSQQELFLGQSIDVVATLKEKTKLTEAIKLREIGKLKQRIEKLKGQKAPAPPEVTKTLQSVNNEELAKTSELIKLFSENLIAETIADSPLSFFDRYKEESGPIRGLADRLEQSTKEHLDTKPSKELSLDTQGLTQISKTTEENIAKLQQTLKSEQMACLQKIRPDTTGIQRAGRLAGDHVDQDIESLIALYIDGSLKEDLRESLEKVLETSNQLAHEKLILSTCRELQQLPDDKVLTETLQKHLSRKAQHLKGEEYYEGMHGRYYRVIEYENGFLLRNSQVSTIREMLNNPNAIRQLIMGGGKSKVLLPILAKAKAQGDNLVMLILPDELFETNLKDLDDTSRKYLNQSVYAFRFSRDTPSDLRSLQEHQLQLLKAMKEKKFIATTKGSLLSFRHSLVEKFEELKSCKSPAKRKALFQELKVIAEIADLMAESSDALADEVQQILDLTKELNYAFGSSVQLMDEHRDKVEVGVTFMRYILEKKVAPNSSTAEEHAVASLADGIRANTQAALDPDLRRKGLEVAAKALLCDWNINDEEILKYILLQTNEAPKALGRPRKSATLDPNTHQLVASERSSPPAGDENVLGKEMRNRVLSLRQFIRKGYGDTLKRSANLNYFRHNDKVVPGAGINTPLINSEMDDDVERVSCYIQSYVQTGITQEQINALVKLEARKAQKELQMHLSEGKVMTIEETQIARNFQSRLEKIDPTGQLNQAVRLEQISPEALKLLNQAVNADPVMLLMVCSEWILPSITLDPQQIRGNASDLVSMVHNFSGVSGTPPPPSVVADTIKTKFAEGVDGKTLSILLEKNCAVDVLHSFDPNNPTQSLLDHADLGQMQAWIDLGAYNKGHSNESVIDGVLAHNKELRAGHFVNSAGFIVSKKQGALQATPLPKDYKKNAITSFTFYDRYVGLDIAQAPTAKAIVTIDATTRLEDLFQAVWRLRQLDQRQSIRFLITEDVRNLMMKGASSNPKVQDVIDFCLRNQGDEEGSLNFRAEVEKITGSVPRAVYRELVGTTLEAKRAEEALNFYEKARSTLISTRASSIEDELEAGLTDHPETVLAKIKENTLQQFDQLEVRGQRVDDAKKELRARNPKRSDLFPQQVPRVATFSTQSTTQTETQQQAQQQTEQQAQVRSEQTVDAGQRTDSNDGQAIYIQPTLIKKALTTTVSNPWELYGMADHLWGFTEKLGIELDEAIFFLPRDERNKLYEKGPRERKRGLPIPVVTLGVWAGFLGREILTFANFDESFTLGNLEDLVNENQLGSSDSLKQICHRERFLPRRALIAETNNGWQTVLGTPQEELNQFVAIAQESSQPGIRRLALVDLQSDDEPKVIAAYSNGIKTSLNPWDNDEEGRKVFLSFVTKVRFFRGEMNYPLKEHREILKGWIEEFGKDEARKQYEQVILHSLSIEKQQEYQGSWLQGFLNS